MSFFELDYPLVVQGREVKLLGIHVEQASEYHREHRLIVQVELDKNRPRFVDCFELPLKSYDKSEFLDLISPKIAERLELKRAESEQRKQGDQLQQYAAHVQSFLKG